MQANLSCLKPPLKEDDGTETPCLLHNQHAWPGLDSTCSPSGSKTASQQVTSAAGSCPRLALHPKSPDSTVQALLLTAVMSPLCYDG